MTLSNEVIEWLELNSEASYIIDESSYLKVIGDNICSYDLWYYPDEDGINVPEWDVHIIGVI